MSDGKLVMMLDQGCTYDISVKTANEPSAGTQAAVALVLSGSLPSPFTISQTDLRQIGVNGPIYPYFQQGQLDRFRVYRTGMGCVKLCRMTLSHDNTGPDPSWDVEYVEVIAFTDNAVKQFDSKFPVNRWLATDKEPYSTSASAGVDCNANGVEARAGLASSLVCPCATNVAQSMHSLSPI